MNPGAEHTFQLGEKIRYPIDGPTAKHSYASALDHAVLQVVEVFGVIHDSDSIGGR